MDKLAVWGYMEAKPGKEREVEEFLKSALPLAQAETGTTTWYALKIGPSQYGIFDTFSDEARARRTFPAKSRKPCLRKQTTYLRSRLTSIPRLKSWPRKRLARSEKPAAICRGLSFADAPG